MKFPRIRFRRILIRLAVAYALICAVMWGYQRNLMYMPQKEMRPFADYKLDGYKELALISTDSTPLLAWYHAAKAGYPTIVYFHGNGGNIGHRAHYYKLLSDMGFGMLALSYRGYGTSEGSPSEAGFYDDARAAISYLKDVQNIAPKQMIFYGESIGTGVAVQMATEFSAGALVLQSPYSSIADVAAGHYPWLPVRILLKDRFESLSKIEKITSPLLLFHGERDNIIPIQFGKLVYDKAPEPKIAVYLPESGHNDLNLRILAEALLRFCLQHDLIKR